MLRFLIILAAMPFVAHAQVTPAERANANAAAMQALNEQLEIERDVPYAQTGNPRHRLDIYRPRQRPATALPVIVFFHGGGWMQGDKADCARMISQVMRSGHFAAVAAGYRLTEEATWPAQLHDSKAAIRWVRANAARYGFDADHIGVWGASAGGHLALMLGVTGDARALEGNIGPHLSVSSRVSAVANFLGITELLALTRPAEQHQWHFGRRAPDRRSVARPRRHSICSFPCHLRQRRRVHLCSPCMAPPIPWCRSIKPSDSMLHYARPAARAIWSLWRAAGTAISALLPTADSTLSSRSIYAISRSTSIRRRLRTGGDESLVDDPVDDPVDNLDGAGST